MKKIFSLCCCFLLSLFSFGQTGTWTWISGTSSMGAAAVYGTMGVPSGNNHPPCIYEPVEWKDMQGNFWLYGGTYPSSYDMWKYNPVTNEWTWVMNNGKATIYGTQGVASSANTPGQRSYGAISWVDLTGGLWLLGGYNDTRASYCNDIWKYDTGANQWTWMNGDTTTNPPGIYGTQGVPSPLNQPGGRTETCSGWTDSLNNLWLFGGYGFDGGGGTYVLLNDVFKYDIGANEWTWMKGSQFGGSSGSYGTKGVEAASNNPDGRFTYTKWKDLQGNFWIMGGASSTARSDLWKYNPNDNNWTWMLGPNTFNDPGNYQYICSFDSTTIPAACYEQRSSVTDECGRFWLFGGRGHMSGFTGTAVCVFDPQQMKWNWLTGYNAVSVNGIYGTEGVPSVSNLPASRAGAAAWWGNDNKYYLFGGMDVGFSEFNDLWVYNPDTNCISVCNSVSVPPPVAGFQSDKTSICANDCISFTNLSTNATSWLWTFNGAIPSTSTDENPQLVCYTDTGAYDVTLVAYNSGGSDSLSITKYIDVASSPPTPGITQHGATLYCTTDSIYTSYQWYDSTTLITGATDTFLVITHSGNYNVQVSNATGCKVAVGINVILNGINSFTVSGLQFTVYPSPAHDELFISFNGKQETVNSKLTIYNVLGEICRQSEILNPKSEIILDVSSLPAAVYFIEVESGEGRWVAKFVKE